jgi:hypothetical protein
MTEGARYFGPRRPDHLVVVLDHFGLLAEHEAEGPGRLQTLSGS